MRLNNQIGVDAFHELFLWVSRLVARSPLQHLNIISDDDKRHGCKGGACLAAVAQQHSTLVSLSAGHVYLGAAFITSVAKACPLLEEIECSPPPPPRVRRMSGPSESVRYRYTEISLAAMRCARLAHAHFDALFRTLMRCDLHCLLDPRVL